MHERKDSRYRGQIDAALAHRLASGGFMYLAYLIVIALTTDIAEVKPGVFRLVCGLTLLAACIRFALCWRFETMYPGNPRAWRVAISTVVLGKLFVWALFIASTLVEFGMGNWKSQLLVLLGAGTASGLMSTLTPALRLHYASQTLFIGPVILACLYTGGTKGLTFALLFSLYLFYLLLNSKRMNEDYLRALARNSELEQARGAAEQASRTKTEFLANISHELRTPMHSIIGMTHLALETKLTEEQRDYMETVDSSSRYLLRLLNELLDLSRIEANKLELDCERVAVRSLIEETIRSFHSIAAGKGLRIGWNCDPAVPETLVGDPGRLRQILSNLVANAVKFTGQGEVRVHASLASRTPETVFLHLTVEDTGPGIAEEKLQIIFKPFEQGDPEISSMKEGAGLGLAICKRLATMMNGRIWVESEPGTGSQFHVMVELAIAPDGAAAAGRESPAGEWGPARRILVAEDNPVNQRLMRRLLEKRGHAVTMVSNGREALAALGGEEFDLILMDVQMPVLDGVETTARIRMPENRQWRHIPILAVTAHASADSRRSLLGAGMDGVLSKPVDPADLYKTIDQFTRDGRPSSAKPAA